MTNIRIHKDVYGDLEQIRLLDSIASIRIVAFLQQATVDPGLLSKLTAHCYRNHEDNLDVKRWGAMHEAGNPVWRLRFVDFSYRDPDYRIFYLASEDADCIDVVAVCKKEDIDYDDLSHPICRRVARCCAQLRGDP